MARYRYPEDFSRSAWSILVADIYVSPQGYDDTGTGSPLSPYRSLQKACDEALDDACIAVAGGVYTESVDCHGKALKIRGEGAVHIDGSKAPEQAAFFNLSASSKSIFSGLMIFDFDLAFSGFMGLVSQCIFINTRITEFTGNIENCICNKVKICVSGKTDIVNTTFKEARLQSVTEGGYFCRFVNNHISSDCKLYFQSALLTRFDYCNQEAFSVVNIDCVEFYTLGDLVDRFPLFQTHGIEETVVFNNIQLTDYTLMNESQLSRAGMGGHYIGAIFDSLYISSSSLNTAELINITVDENDYFVMENTALETGTVVSRVIDLSEERLLGEVHVELVVDMTQNTNLKVDSGGPLFQSNKSRYKLKYGLTPTEIERAEFKEFAWGYIPTVDKRGLGNGTGHHSPRSSSLISARYIQIEFSIRKLQEPALQLESGDFLLRENHDFILL